LIEGEHIRKIISSAVLNNREKGREICSYFACGESETESHCCIITRVVADPSSENSSDMDDSFIE
jgi:hypothetical protein